MACCTATLFCAVPDKNKQGFPVGILFACGACGSPAVEPPRVSRHGRSRTVRAFIASATDTSWVPWGTLRERAKELIRTELATREPKRGWVRSSDPLPGLRVDGQDRIGRGRD